MTFCNIDLDQVPYPEVNSRCALYERGIPTDSTVPAHLDLCRKGSCGSSNQNAENIVKQAKIITLWQTHPKLSAIYNKLVVMPSNEINSWLIEEELEAVGVKAQIYDQQGSRIPNNPVDTLILYLGNQSIKLIREPSLSITNGRHRLCAAKKFGVKRLLVNDTTEVV